MAAARNSKAKRPPSHTRQVVGDNVRKLAERVYAHIPAETDRYRALAKDAQTTLSQVQRIVKGQIGTSVDYVEWLAGPLGVAAHQLLVPHYAERAEIDGERVSNKGRANAA